MHTFSHADELLRMQEGLSYFGPRVVVHIRLLALVQCGRCCCCFHPRSEEFLAVGVALVLCNLPWERHGNLEINNDFDGHEKKAVKML